MVKCQKKGCENEAINVAKITIGNNPHEYHLCDEHFPKFIENYDREKLILELWRENRKKVLKGFSFWQKRKLKCKNCGKKYRDWEGPGYIGLNMGDICVCGRCFNKDLREG
ncbi:hypothetical protein LCGC14_2424160 [marine sediment metagenome]|uniref:Uncharacterized protein n=1 Tax=marine sediment metagenome TaxID=412755 RepID=A0A0F9E0W2_9ZZZZ